MVQKIAKEELWESVLLQIQSSVSQANFNTWFKSTDISSIKDSVAYISVPNTFVKEWLENKYNKLILKTLNSINGEVKEIRYVVNSRPSPSEKSKFAKERIKTINENQMALVDFSIDKETNLNLKYTFENFVVGSFNELPHAAGQAVSQNPGSLYNPLFIYGGVGLGKTHLMQAIGNEILKNLPNKKIKYVSVEKFTSEVVSSIRNKSMESFKSKYRNIDILIIDDVQFLSGKEKTQEEFFHTFNALYEKNKQIIISSDRPPRAIQALTERLKSRFEGGMITDISQPEIETRLAILKTKAREKNVDFPEDIYTYIATNIKQNIRELEGALNKLIAHKSLRNQIIDIESAKKILERNLPPAKVKTPQKIIKSVSHFYDIKEKDILQSSRKKEIVKPRQITMYLLREDLKCSFPFIGRKLGGKDHTTVIHSCEKVRKDLEKDENLRGEIELIRQFILSL